jgi:hypothetical protein
MRRAKVGLFLLLVAAGCGGTEEPKESRVNIVFPSTKAAVASDTVQMLVYEATDPNACLDLVQRRRTNQDPSRRVITGMRTPITTCDFLARGVPSLSLGYGRRAFFVLVQRDESDFLIGCTLQGVGDEEQTIDVALTPVNSGVSVPDTTCGQLSAKCAGSCK